MAYTSVPFSVKALIRDDREALMQRLSEMNASEVFLVLDGFEEMDEDLPAIQEAIPFFHAHGMRVSAWVCTLSCHTSRRFHCYLTDINGRPSPTAVCPLDDEFRAYYLENMRRLARTGLEQIALDDDFRISMLTTPHACFCEKHLERYGRRLGKPVTREMMKEHIYAGGENPYRTAWLCEGGESLRMFAREIRHAVDEVDEKINICLCSGPAHWGADGVTGDELARIFAGKNPPRLRLSGAPYWDTFTLNVRLAGAVDYARRQANHCRKLGIDTLAEGDCYPRPRYTCAASVLECFDLIIRADGNFSGILKYGLDYYSSPNYEPGYAKRTQDNQALYRQVEEDYGKGKPRGVFVYEPFDTAFYAQNVPDGIEMRLMKSPAVMLLNDVSLPAVFEPDSAMIVFGGAAEKMDLNLIGNGAILDIESAAILTRRGVDVGLMEEREQDTSAFIDSFSRASEYFYEEDERVALYGNVRRRTVTLRAGALVQSAFRTPEGDSPASYLYENASGQRFLVFCFDGEAHKNVIGLFRSYCRQRQMIEAVEWIGREKLAAVCAGHPDLYMMLKQEEDALTVGLWNLSRDRVEKACIQLADAYKTACFTQCVGELKGNEVVLESTLYPYEFCSIRLIHSSPR